MHEKMRSRRDRLIEMIVDRDVSDHKGARESRALELKKMTTHELEKIWEDPKRV
jgi:hypothetical protein